MTEGTTSGVQRRVRPDLGASEAVPEADVVEQQADVLDLTDTADPGTTESLTRRDRWYVEAEAVSPDDDRVVALDDDEYR